MTKEDFLQGRSELLKQQADFKKEIDIKYGDLTNKFIRDNIPYAREQVVLIGDGKKAKRMVIFQIEPMVFDNHLIVNLYGWYLDAENKPIKWEGHGIPVSGVSNPKTISVSDNQKWQQLNS